MDFDPADRQFGWFVGDVGNENNFAGVIEFLVRVQSHQQPFAHMKFFGDGFARARITERLEAFHIFHFRGKFFQERSLHIVLRDPVLIDDGIFAGPRKRRPNLGRERLIGDQAFRLCEGSQGLLRVFAELAVDFPGRELSPVQKNLRLYDDCIDLVLSRRLRTIFSVIDRRRIKAGSRRRKHQPGQKNDRDEPADHPATLSKMSDNNEFWARKFLASETKTGEEARRATAYIPSGPGQATQRGRRLAGPGPSSASASRADVFPASTSTAASPAFRPAFWHR